MQEKAHVPRSSGICPSEDGGSKTETTNATLFGITCDYCRTWLGEQAADCDQECPSRRWAMSGELKLGLGEREEMAR